ncbi:MAG: LysR family transcriptional regulator, partial [Syntrophaceae bacterium]
MPQDRFRNITIQQMDALVRVIEMRSFSRAAKSMNLTQPALTKHIKNLEDAIGFRVAERGYSGISLTREGRLLYDYARRILKLRDEAREKIINSRLNEDGNIYISASTIPATYILPSVLSSFRRAAPGIKAYVR